jgi:hypothetical protein
MKKQTAINDLSCAAIDVKPVDYDWSDTSHAYGDAWEFYEAITCEKCDVEVITRGDCKHCDATGESPCDGPVDRGRVPQELQDCRRLGRRQGEEHQGDARSGEAARSREGEEERVSKVTRKTKARIANTLKKREKRRRTIEHEIRYFERNLKLLKEANDLNERLDKLIPDVALPGDFPVDVALGAVFAMFAATVKGDDAVIAQNLASMRLARYTQSIGGKAMQRKRGKR